MKKFNVIALSVLALVLFSCNTTKKAPAEEIEKPMEKEIKNNDKAVLGGGCFWCIETIFDELQGVNKVTSGYAGGKTENPTYKEVSLLPTGHVEVIEVDYNPQIISYEELLDVFWHVHDPTTLNRQGNDVGEQYRSVIFYNSPEQKVAAEKSLKESEASGLWGDKKYTTTIESLPTFYSAEDYHQDYYKNNPNQPYCSAVISPKVQKFREKYKDKLKPNY